MSEAAERKRERERRKREAEHLRAIEGFEDRQWLYGPRLVAWLRSEYWQSMSDVSGTWGDAVARRLWEWENSGDPVHYSSADRLLCRLGIVLDLEVPDECWIVGKNHGQRAGTHRDPETAAKRKEKGLRLLGQGKTPREVADELGVASTTVRKWREGAAKQARMDPFEGLDYCPLTKAWVRPQVAA